MSEVSVIRDLGYELISLQVHVIFLENKRASLAVRISSNKTRKASLFQAWPSCRTILMALIEKDTINNFHRSLLKRVHTLEYLLCSASVEVFLYYFISS